jgi:hypothetical protein
MEHNWDQGFGLYGAARHLNDLTDAQIAYDVAKILMGWATDLYSEYNWGHS